MGAAVHFPRAFWRSPLTRWAFIATGIFIAFTLSPWTSDRWRSAPSLLLLHHALPWPVMFSGFLVYVLLLATGRLLLVIAGEALGAFMYGGDFIAICITASDPHHPVNGLVMVAVLLATVLQLFLAGVGVSEWIRR